MRSEAIGGAWRETGRFTSSPCCIIGAATMKMIRSTNITSTRGTTLISDRLGVSLGPRPRLEDGEVSTAAVCTLGTLDPYVKFRSQMFRNSSAKSSICEANSFTRCVKRL